MNTIFFDLFDRGAGSSEVSGVWMWVPPWSGLNLKNMAYESPLSKGCQKKRDVPVMNSRDRDPHEILTEGVAGRGTYAKRCQFGKILPTRHQARPITALTWISVCYKVLLVTQISFAPLNRRPRRWLRGNPRYFLRSLAHCGSLCLKHHGRTNSVHHIVVVWGLTHRSGGNTQSS